MDGAVVAGHTVGHLDDDRRGELRYAARSPHGEPRTLVASRRRYAGRAARVRFRRLAAVRIELDHPGALPVYAVVEHGHRPMLVTDPYPESTLADLLRHEAPLEPARVVAMLAPVADALDVAHSRGLVHLTLGGESLLLAGRDRLLLDGFGLLAGEVGEDLLGLTISGARHLGYCPPEQARGQRPGPAANVYSLAAVAVHALTGAPPYSGSGAATLVAHLSQAPPRVYERVPQLGREIDAVIDRAMAKDPSARYKSAAALVQAVAEATGVPRPEPMARRGRTPARSRLQLVPEPAYPAPSVPARPARGRPLRSALAVVGVAVAVALGVAAGAAIAPFGGDDPAPVGRPDGTAQWRRVDDQRAALRGQLADAKVPDAQAQAAAALADLYSGAARSDAPASLRAAARDAAGAYSTLADAARRHDTAAYADAVDGVTRVEERLVLAASRH